MKYGKESKKLLSLILCGVLAFGAVGAVSYAAGAKKSGKEENRKADETVSEKNSSGTEKNEDELSASKDETVYVIAGADGTAKKIIVSDWIKNEISGKEIKDGSVLDDVTNVNGEESYKMNSDGMRVWDAQGNDIYYQGDIEKELPVDIAISYRLDGKPVSAEELAGKSGRVTMRFDYTNKQCEDVEIDGVKETLYVPFVMLTGMILDNETFTNVEVSNGRLINDGSHSVVIGFALPGLQKNLGIDREKADLPEYVEVSADVKAFELTTTMTVAANECFSSIDLDQAGTVDELEESLGKLTDAMDQLMDGSSELYNGLTTLLNQSGNLIDGIDRLSSGSVSLADGAKTMKSGTENLESGAAQLKDGTKSLYEGAGNLKSGLDELAAGSDNLNRGAKQVFDSLLTAADSQLAAAGISAPALTIDNYDQVLTDVMGSLDENAVRSMAYQKALEAVTAKVRENTVAVSTQVEAVIREQVTATVLAAAGNPMTIEQYRAILNGAPVDEASQAAAARIQAEVEAQMNSEQIQGTISSTTEGKIQELIDQNMGSSEVAAQIDAAVESAKNGAAGIGALKSQLDAYSQFYTGLKTYTDGVASARDGAGRLVSGAAGLDSGMDSLKNGAGNLDDGAGSLVSGSEALRDGLKELKGGSGALVDGVTRLKDGAIELSDGLKEFREEGIQKLVDAFDGDFKELVNRIRATVDVSKKYQSFAGISGNMSGNVKFIYKTDAIEQK